MLFRFLQLLCEGHNEDFQNYLRTQIGNNTTVNIIISTVDYLLRLQESVSDFYWYYSSKDQIDENGKQHFSSAIKMAKQVFNSLTEYIQGPCVGNQNTLAHSRLWDAVVGFWHVFAQLQCKLSKDSGNSLALLAALLDLQQDMIVMLLSMLEGNIVNGTIGRQLLDTLIEAQQDVQLIIKYFTMFLKLDEVVESEKFKDLDPDNKGILTKREFQRQLEGAKNYDPDEVEYVLKCVQTDENDRFDYKEFVDQFHSPAEEIGFNFVLLLTSLNEHMTADTRLDKFLNIGKEMLDYFENNLGRIEILGSSKRIERIYFNIQQSSLEQWEKPQIRDSKRQFIFDVIVSEGGDKGKMEEFVDFCEDTIFEMQLASSISVTCNTEGEKIVEEENEDEEDDISRFGFFVRCKFQMKNLMKLFIQMFTMKFLKKCYRLLKHVTMKDLTIFVFIIVWRSGKGILKCIWQLLHTLGQFLMTYLFSGSLVELAKETTISGFIEAIPEPTQDGIGSRFEDEPEDDDEEESATEIEMPIEMPIVASAFGIDIRADGTAAFAEYVDDRVLRHTGFGDQDFDEAARNLGMEYDEGAFGQQEEIRARKYEHRHGEEDEIDTSQTQLELRRLKEASTNANPWDTYANPCRRPKKYMSDAENTENISALRQKFVEFVTSFLAFFARNFYNFKSAALIISFLLNLILLSLRWEAKGWVSILVIHFD